jgi:rhomboid family GlyGly-CTERM serine protease
MNGPSLAESRGSLALPWFTSLGAAIAAGLWLLLGPTPEALVFDRTAIADGEVWRLITGHLVHSDSRHALWDIAALALLGCLMGGQGWRREAVAAGASLLAVNVCLWWGLPDLERYCGLSGVLNGLMVVALTELWRRQRHPLFPAAALLLALKLAVEMATGRSVLANLEWPGVPLAHVAGCLGGLAFLVLDSALRARPVHRANRGFDALVEPQLAPVAAEVLPDGAPARTVETRPEIGDRLNRHLVAHDDGRNRDPRAIAPIAAP